MVNKLIGALIAIVIGLALLPVVYNFANDLTTSGGALDGTTAGGLVDLLPIVYVIILVAGAVGFVATSRKN